MWCAYCTQEITYEEKHSLCRDAVWRQVCEEFTRVKLAFMNQDGSNVHKGETVEVRTDA
jgi:hypothetical protein